MRVSVCVSVVDCA